MELAGFLLFRAGFSSAGGVVVIVVVVVVTISVCAADISATDVSIVGAGVSTFDISGAVAPGVLN